jgi:hypothetical protein
MARLVTAGFRERPSPASLFSSHSGGSMSDEQIDQDFEETEAQEKPVADPTTYEELLLHPSIRFFRPHVLWEACSYIKAHPGCRLRDINMHLLDTYPHGRPAHYKVSGVTLEMSGIAAHHIRQPDLGFHKAGIYIAGRGLLLLSGPKPQFKQEAPKLHPAEWALTPEIGAMYAPRGSRTPFYVEKDYPINTATGPSVQRQLGLAGYLSKDEVMVLIDASNVKRVDDASTFRLHGGPIAFGYAEFMADGKRVTVEVASVKVLGRRLKRKS